MEDTHTQMLIKCCFSQSLSSNKGRLICLQNKSYYFTPMGSILVVGGNFILISWQRGMPNLNTHYTHSLASRKLHIVKGGRHVCAS